MVLFLAALAPVLCLIIFASIFSYNFITATGRMETIKKLIISGSSEKSVLVLLLVWGLGNFLEGIAGYGTAVAIPVGIMIALGFNPFFPPFIGALGTFITGSDTSSCILFGEFQKRVAIDLGVNEYWLTGANMSGATAGKMISPQGIAIAAAAAGIAGQESALFRKTAFYCLFYVIFLGFIIFFFSGVSPWILSAF